MVLGISSPFKGGGTRGDIAAQVNGFATTRDWTLQIGIVPLGIGFGAIHAMTRGEHQAQKARTPAPGDIPT